MSKRYVVIEHIKLSRDISDSSNECDDCKCLEIEQAYECDCDCHVEIREQQKIVVEADTEEEADDKAGEICTLTIVGDSDIIDFGLAADQDKIGIISTKSETYKSYD